MSKSSKRWKEAQKVELELWKNAVSSLDRVLTDVYLGSAKLNEFIKNAKRLPLSFDKVLEIGIGPLGIGWAGVFANGSIFGIEPLPILHVKTENAEFNKFIAKLQERVKIVKAVGENIPFSDGFFDSVVCGNVIDHAKNPSLVIHEAYRVLKPNGHLILSVNCFSILGIIKWRLYTTKRYSDSPAIVAHPHSYLSKHLREMIRAVGFEVCMMSKESLLNRWIDHSHRIYVIAKKVS